MEKHFLGYRMIKRKDTQYTNRRNSALIARYYYLSEIKRLRFDDVITRLSLTFFLSDTYVMRILRDSSDSFNEMLGERPGKEALKSNWPEYEWS